jgi:hypothetical protein
MHTYLTDSAENVPFSVLNPTLTQDLKNPNIKLFPILCQMKDNSLSLHNLKRKLGVRVQIRKIM